MKTQTILFISVLLIAVASCKKDEYVRNNDIITDTVALISFNVPDVYMLYDNAHLYLDATTEGALSYQWLPTNETSPVVEFIPNDYLINPWTIASEKPFGCYEVIVTLANTTIKYGIGVFADDAVVYCPSAFTPDNNGMNDKWGAYYIYQNLIKSLNIYDQNNRRLFHSGGNDDPLWDGKYKGKLCDVGTYYYTLHYTTPQGGKKSREGMFQLLR
jgi:gliding motility-associated-like protein